MSAWRVRTGSALAGACGALLLVLCACRATPLKIRNSSALAPMDISQLPTLAAPGAELVGPPSSWHPAVSAEGRAASRPERTALGLPPGRVAGGPAEPLRVERGWLQVRHPVLTIREPLPGPPRPVLVVPALSQATRP